jgi:hypothetical protein
MTGSRRVVVRILSALGVCRPSARRLAQTNGDPKVPALLRVLSFNSNVVPKPQS